MSLDINKPISYKIVGAGTFARVFKIDTDHVLKKPRQSDRNAGSILHNDFQKHIRIRAQFEYDESVSVPMVHRYVGIQDDFWRECRDLFEETVSGPGFGLFAERIPPLDAHFRRTLVERYCPPRLRDAVWEDEASEDCLVRVYLGRRRERRVNSKLADSLFSLRNYPLCLDQMEELNIPIEHLCKSMARALAMMHWSICVDARDVEFVLGAPSCRHRPMRNVDPVAGGRSDETFGTGGDYQQELDCRIGHATFNFRKPRACLWLLDFNQVGDLGDDASNGESMIRKALDAFWTNDPYFPRPNEVKLWQTFSKEYLKSSTATGKDLPMRFLAAVEQESQRRRRSCKPSD